MKHLFSVLAGCAFLGTLVAADDPMAEIMAVTQKNSVTVKEKQTDKKGSDKIPVKRRSVFTFKTPSGERQIIYNRWLNKQPDFKGNHPSLNWESGVGFGVGKFGNWYGNNTIRVFINESDVNITVTLGKVKKVVLPKKKGDFLVKNVEKRYYPLNRLKIQLTIFYY